MTLLLGWIANTLSGGLLNTAFGWVTTWIGGVTNLQLAKVTAATQVTQATLATQVASEQASTQASIADKGWWLTAAMKPVAFYTFMLHTGAIVLDSTFKFGWGIPKLPSPYDAMETNVIYLCIGIAGAFGLSRIIKK